MFNEKVMSHVLNPRNSGSLEGATSIGCIGIPGEGRYIKIYVVVKDETIKCATYECNGCPASIASASIVCQLSIGKPVDFADVLEGKDVLLMLGGLPEGKEDMAQVAVDALRTALNRSL